MIFLFYGLAILALLVSTFAIYGALIEAVPLKLLRIHYFIRKPLVMFIMFETIFWGVTRPEFPMFLVGPLIIEAVAIILTFRMHQEVAFPALDLPPHVDAESLPLSDDMEIAVIDYDGETCAYALDHLIHHHIINDRLGDKIVSITYCAMCRSIIPFDVTDIGPLVVASFKNANMIVADRKTKTWFQQATFQSELGPLHPHELTMIPYQILTWKELRESGDIPEFARFTQKDLRAFELPIPGVWRKIMSSEATPGLSANRRDTTLPARTHVIGLIDKSLPPLAFKREDVRRAGVVHRPDLGITLVSAGGGVLGFRTEGAIALKNDGTLSDPATGAEWTLRGKAKAGTGGVDLVPVALSDEYWFSWKFFHPKTTIESI